LAGFWGANLQHSDLETVREEKLNYAASRRSINRIMATYTTPS
jgi:hypothetical protein